LPTRVPAQVRGRGFWGVDCATWLWDRHGFVRRWVYSSLPVVGIEFGCSLMLCVTDVRFITFKLFLHAYYSHLIGCIYKQQLTF
jgi:hypothetical protein